jgi:hypothetical protein
MTRIPFLIGMTVMAILLLASLLGEGPPGLNSPRARGILESARPGSHVTPYQARGETAVRFGGQWVRSHMEVTADGQR